MWAITYTWKMLGFWFLNTNKVMFNIGLIQLRFSKCIINLETKVKTRTAEKRAKKSKRPLWQQNWLKPLNDKCLRSPYERETIHFTLYCLLRAVMAIPWTWLPSYHVLPLFTHPDKAFYLIVTWHMQKIYNMLFYNA